MGLAAALIADEQQAGLLKTWELVHIDLHTHIGALQIAAGDRVVVTGQNEIVERGMLVQGRNLRPILQLVGAFRLAAFAALGARNRGAIHYNLTLPAPPEATRARQ